MYRLHQPTISTWARSSPDNLARVIQFCVASARVKFQNVPAVMAEADRGDPSALFGWKYRAWHEAWDRRADIYWNCEDIARGHGPRALRADYMLAYLAGEVHGLNIAKAGFTCQLAYGMSACLDSVNARRLSLPTFNSRAWYMKRQTTPARRLRLAQRYNGLVRRLGGTARLWNDWCETVSANNKQRWPFGSAEDVSAWHLECLGIFGR